MHRGQAERVGDLGPRQRQAERIPLVKTPAGPRAGNLFEPAPGGTQAARGRFDAEASLRPDIYSSREADAVAAGVALSGVIGLLALATSRLLRGPALVARMLPGAP